MSGLAKSILYQLKREKLIYAVFLIAVIIGILQALIGEGIEAESLSEFVPVIGSSLYGFVYMFMGVAVAKICGSDFGDKTFNYEIMSGHTRSHIYIVRAAISIVVACVASMLAANIPIFIVVIIKGFGTKLSLGSVILRQLLCFFPILRLTCFYIFLTFIVRNQYIVMGISYFIFLISMILESIPSHILAFTNVSMLCTYQSYSSFSFSGDEYYIYDGSLSINAILLTIVISMAVSVFWIISGYVFYKKDDLR